ncbi:MAG: hypothetical protein ACRD0X_05920 [Thermoanaerobaculia bacterium]
MRSRGPVDVERIARQLGGGGHKNAAGFETAGERGPLLSRLVGELQGALSEAAS